MTEPRVFRADPKFYRNQLLLIGGIVIVVVNLGAYFKLEERNWKFYAFMNGLAVFLFVGRYLSMMGFSGPKAVTFDAKGVCVGNQKTRTTITWEDLEGVRYRFSRGGHYWVFSSRPDGRTVDYFIDGLTSRQQDDLRQFIADLKAKLPEVEIDTVGKMEGI